MRATTVALAAAFAAHAFPHAALAAPETARAGPWSVELVDESGAALPTFHHAGRTYVLGALGQRYLVRVHNGSGRRVEVVASVDGRDVIDGRPASREKRGYLVAPWATVTLDGFRTSERAVAAFRFSSVARSYAAQMGDARDVGVVGVAIFPERWPEPAPRAPLAAPGAPSEQRSGAAPSAKGNAERGRADDLARPGLGTEFGEEHESRVVSVPFERASAAPAAVLSLRYDDREGLLALGVDVDGRLSSADADAWLRRTAEPFRRDGFAEPPPSWRR